MNPTTEPNGGMAYSSANYDQYGGQASQQGGQGYANETGQRLGGRQHGTSDSYYGNSEQAGRQSAQTMGNEQYGQSQQVGQQMGNQQYSQAQQSGQRFGNEPVAHQQTTTGNQQTGGYQNGGQQADQRIGGQQAGGAGATQKDTLTKWLEKIEQKFGGERFTNHDNDVKNAALNENIIKKLKYVGMLVVQRGPRMIMQRL